jgi:RHS repeat-associated protein
MQSAQLQTLSESPLAAKPQLSEKPRLGFESKKTTGKPGSSVCNFTVTLGLRATVVENDVRKTYRARYYNPATGRFLSRDPEDPDMGNPNDPKTLHKYLYSGGDPINAMDPTGHGILETGEIDLGVALPALTELVVVAGTAAANAAAAAAVDAALAAMDGAATFFEAASDLMAAARATVAARFVSRVFVCAAVGLGYAELVDIGDKYLSTHTGVTVSRQVDMVLKQAGWVVSQYCMAKWFPAPPPPLP